MTKRNQIIDIAKLVFCFGVLFNHTNSLGKGISDGYYVIAQYGFLGVEFFFIVSGFLMAKKALHDKCEDVGKATIRFIGRKFSIVYPYFFVAWIIAFIIDNCIHKYPLGVIINHLVKSIPYHLQLYMTGIPVYNILGPTWYISAMIVCMFIMYPFVKKLKAKYIYIVAPIIVISLYGYLGVKVGNLAVIGPLDDGFIYMGLYRGFAGLSLGCICFGICEYIKSIKWTKTGGSILTLIEISSYIIALLCIQTQNYFRPDFIFVIFVCISITISFSGMSNTSKMFKKDYPLIGQLSLVLYLANEPARVLTRVVFSSLERMGQIVPAFVLTFLFGIIILIGGNFLKKIFAITKEKLQRTMICE